jgi:hypothetical protein
VDHWLSPDDFPFADQDKFLIQADFILAANREDLDDSHEKWNNMLLRGIAEAFELAALQFQTTSLKDSWIQFLPISPEPCFALSMLPKLIQDRLRKVPILKLQNEAFVAGPKAVFVPRSLRTSEGRLLLDDQTSLHEMYDAFYLIYLKWLGVTTMDSQGFFSRLKTYIAQDSGRYFHEQDVSWHAEIARTLNEHPEISTSDIAELPLIPLQDGRWVATKHNIVSYEPSDTTVMERIPQGLDHIHMVERSASADPSRMQLLQRLAVKQFDTKQVCNLIVAQHRRPAKSTYTAPILASHLVYLFHSKHDLRSSNAALWLFTHKGAVERSSQLYIDLPGPIDPVSRHLADGPAKSLMLHNDILQAVQGSKAKEWVAWLIDNLGVSEILKVANPQRTSVTAEFAHFLKHRLPSVSLAYLMKHWDILFPQDKVPIGVSQAISSVQIALDGHQRQRLDTLSLGCNELKAIAPKGLPFLDLPSIETDMWDNLKHFGVGVKNHYNFVRHCLRQLKMQEATKQEVIPLYQLLQKCFARDEANIRYVKIQL